MRVVVVCAVGLLLAACELVSHSGDFDEVSSFVVVNGEGGIGCPSSQQTCVADGGATTCANLASDNANCGACGRACAGGLVCSGGMCLASCSTGESACSVGCVDTSSDPQNCGACGTTCKANELCSEGTCSATCATGTKMCGTTCVDKAYGSDCGPCNGGKACAAGIKCEVGFCIACAQCSTDGPCIDPLTDNQNCGSCGNVCGAAQTCTKGICKCNTGTACGTACLTPADLKTTTNCGACGNACASGASCSLTGAVSNMGPEPAGTYACSCPIATPIVCGNTCVSVLNDPNNCGRCGNVCGVGKKNCAGGACTSL